MGQKEVETKVVLPPETDLELKRWAEQSDRSKRRHIAVVLRRVVNLRKSDPQAAEKLLQGVS